MKNSSKCPWSKTILVISIITFIALFAISAYLFASDPNNYMQVCVAILIVVVLLVTFALTPLRVIVEEKGVTVRLMCGRKFVPRDQIVKVVPFKNDAGTIRLFGSGGLFGFTGIFRNAELGVFSCLATDLKKSYVIYRKDKRPVVISVDDPEIWKELGQ